MCSLRCPQGPPKTQLFEIDFLRPVLVTRATKKEYSGGAPRSENDAEIVPKWGPIIVYLAPGNRPFGSFYHVLAPRAPQGSFLSHFDTILAPFGTIFRP